MRTTLRVAAFCLVLSLSFSMYASPRDVPLTIENAGALIVQARINGSGPYRFLVDTGSSRSVITQSLCDRLGAPLVARTEVIAAGSAGSAAIARVDSMSIGVAAAGDLLVMISPDRVLRELGSNVDGIVGQDFLGRFNFLVDRDRRTLTWNPSAAERPDRGVSLHLVPSEGRTLVELPQRHGGEALLMVPDSGADVMVIFASPRAARLPMQVNGAPIALAGLGGTRSARNATVAKLQIGDELLTGQRAVYADVAAAGSDGLLPMKMFRRYWFDNEARVLTVWR